MGNAINLGSTTEEMLETRSPGGQFRVGDNGIKFQLETRSERCSIYNS